MVVPSINVTVPVGVPAPTEGRTVVEVLLVLTRRALDTEAEGGVIAAGAADVTAAVNVTD